VPDAWFTLDPELDDAGTLVGQRLRLGLGSFRARYVDLPPESTAAGPFGRIVVVTSDDERRSQVRAIDARARCSWQLGSSPDVVRAATLAPDGSAIFEFRVDRTSRADLGVWRRPLDSAPMDRLLPPLPADDHFGPTWSTSLGWSADGDRLVVQSCAAAACRTRVVDPVTRASTLIDAPDQGVALGLMGDTLVSYAACHALPCPIVATDLATRTRRLIAAAAGHAVLAAAGNPGVVVETPEGAAIHRLDGVRGPTLGRPQAAAQLVPSVLGATASPGLPDGWVGWARDARSPAGATLTRLSDGRAVPVEEVAP
jgi:hypothetical protein